MVCAFERVDAPDSWQLPQGGIERGEQARDAVWRELEEETGFTESDVELVAEYPEWVVYEWPPEVATADRRGIGQAQRWFTFRLLSPASEPSPDGSEFSAWRWVTPDWLVDHVIPFRRPVYRRVLLSRSHPTPERDV